jgi:hypothetical protein
MAYEVDENGNLVSEGATEEVVTKPTEEAPAEENEETETAEDAVEQEDEAETEA